MNVFIIGASGLVGSNCLKHFAEQGWNVKGSYFSYPTDNCVFFNTLDLNHPDNFDLLNWKPDIIIHCGALTHVDYCEQHPEESYEKTVQSTLNIIAIAKASNAKLVYLSTDYIYDGLKGPYQEDAAINPISIYGKHKLLAEESVLQYDNALVIRITNVYGDEERGKNFIARIIQQCKEGQHLTLKLPIDQYATPTNAMDIAKAMFLLLKDQHKGVFNIGSTDYMNRVALALRVLKYFPNASYDLIPLSTAALQQAAARPLLGGFISTKFHQLYPEFLFSTVDDYMQKQIID